MAAKSSQRRDRIRVSKPTDLKTIVLVNQQHESCYNSKAIKGMNEGMLKSMKEEA